MVLESVWHGPRVSQKLDRLGEYSLLVVAQWKQDVLTSGKSLTDLSLGDPKEPTPEFIRQALVANLSPSSSYPAAHGTAEQRQAASAWLQRRFSLTVPPDAILPTAGSKEAIFHFMQVLEPGLKVAYPVPGYPVYASAIAMAGHQEVHMRLSPDRGFAFDPETDLAEMPQAAWVCSPHNPTGTVLNRDQMEKILKWSRNNNVLLLSDECYVDNFDPGTPAPGSFLELSRKDNFKGVLSFFSLSKRSGMTGYRSGFVAGDPVYIKAFKSYRPHAGLASPTFVQQAAAAAWSDDDHVAQRALCFAEKRKAMCGFFRQRGWTMVDSGATFYLWVCLPPGYPPAKEYLEKLAHDTGIVATPGLCFGSDESLEKWFRVALVPSTDEIVRALKAWNYFEDQQRYSAAAQ